MRISRILALLLLISPAWAAVAHGGACAGTSTGCTPSSASVFQFELMASVRAGSTTAPGNPAGWQNIITKAGTSSNMRITARTVYSATAAASGSSTNATNVGVVGFTGTGARGLLASSITGVAIGTVGTATSGSTQTPSCPAITLQNNSGSSWVVCAIYNASGASNNCSSAPSGMTLVSSASTGDVAIYDTNGGVSSWTAQTCTLVASANWIAETIEIMAPLANPPTLSQLVNGDGGLGTYQDQTPIGNGFRYKVDPALGGNTRVISLAYTRSVSRTLTIANDQSQTATLAVSCDDVGNALTFATYYIQNETAGASLLTFTFDAAISNFQQNNWQFSGMLTTGSATDGTHCATQTPANNNLGNMTDATGITTTSDGDLIFYSAFSEGFGNFGSTVPPSDIIFGSGYTGLYGDLQNFGGAAEAKIQTTHGAISPVLTIMQSSHDVFGFMTVAFKTSAGSGTPRTTGKIVRKLQQSLSSSATGNNNAVVFPCDTGNFIMITFDCTATQQCNNVNTTTDTAGNVWTNLNIGGGNYEQFIHAQNATCNGQDYINFAVGGGALVMTRFTVYELAGAATTSQVATTTSANITTAGQTSLSVTSGTGIANNDYLLLWASGTAGTNEVVKVTAGGGTGSLTVTRAQFGTTAFSSLSSGAKVVDLTASGLIDTSSANSGAFTQNLATTTSAAITSSGQTSLSLTAAGGISNGDYIVVGNGTVSEVMQVTAGGGTTSLTVTRGAFGMPVLASLASGANVVISFTGTAVSITTGFNNEVVFCSQNQTIGPSYDVTGATNDFGFYGGMSDTNPMANGDDNCHYYAPSTGTTNLGWYLANFGSNQNGFASGVGVRLAATASNVTPPVFVIQP